MKTSLSIPCKAAWVLSILAVAALSPLAGAQSYPSKPIRLIVPFPPGGAVDAIGRIIGQGLGKSFGHNVVIDNRGGAAGAIGSEIAARAPADGYTLLVGSTSTISVNPALNPKLVYNPQRDFVPVSLVGFVPHVLLVNPSVPAATVTDFVAFVKAQQKPVTYASVGVGSPHHLAGEIFKGMTGIDMVHVPYTGSGPALIGLMGGQVHFLSLDMPAALPQLGTGRVKALGIAASKRDPLVPDLPTVAESGLPGFEISGWYGIFAPIKTPKDIVAKLSAEIARQLATSEMRGSLAKIGVNVLGGSPAEVAAYIRREDAKCTKAIRDSGTKIE
ncbi:MAG: tripartite tricarboxylate transporter substrate binding protein [Betaproteobacteria bacterium]|nr:tripartite tricarboxylate transporter substrate binding protein [Betaproteobacteria bacterium]